MGILQSISFRPYYAPACVPLDVIPFLPWVPNEHFPHLYPPQRGVQPIPRFSMLYKSSTRTIAVLTFM